MAPSVGGIVGTQWTNLRMRLLSVGGEFPTRRYSVYGWMTGTTWVPPSAAKRHHLVRLFNERGHTVFIEAGTYKGETVAALVPHAERIISVELDERLHAAAVERFRAAPSVEILLGDATNLVPQAAADGPPALIFLDGHFSGEGTALGDEVEPAPHILERLGRVAVPGTTIVVDDLRLFGTAPDYPQLDVIVTAARAGFPDANIRVGLDSLVIEA